MDKNQVFRINKPQIVSETIDGEVVIVNLDKGYYYSLLNTGAAVWQRIERQLDRDEIVRELMRIYDGSGDEITNAIDEFLKNLQSEEIIMVSELSDLSPIEQNSTEPRDEVVNKRLFEKPILEKFTDMEDLLLLDPIHEVDVDAGWPNVKTT